MKRMKLIKNLSQKVMDINLHLEIKIDQLKKKISRNSKMKKLKAQKIRKKKIVSILNLAFKNFLNREERKESGYSNNQIFFEQKIKEDSKEIKEKPQDLILMKNT